MHALFGHAITLPEGFEERSQYLFYLDEPGAKARPGGAGSGAFPAALRPGLGGAPAGGQEGFAPTVVVTRERTAQPLASFVAEQRKHLGEYAPKMSVVKDGQTKVAGQPAHQSEVAVSLESPRLQLVQQQVVTLRDGYAYCFFLTTTRPRFEQDRARFEAFISAWK